MAENNKLSRGSEWRKWDLHVHTASSYDYAYKADDADSFLANALINNEFAAVAITDHFIIDNTRIKNLRKLASNIVFFPGVELRTDKGDTNIHIILIFSDTISLDDLVEDFKVFKRSKAKNPDDNTKIYWDFNDIIEFAKNHDALISIHAGKKTNGVDDRISNSLEHNQAVKQEFADNIHIFEMGKVQDLEDYRSKVFPTIGTKPMIICSDNHDARSFTLKTNCWIKADPTFEGLKQILYEPEERVRIQETKPEEKFGYNVIDSVILNEDKFWKNEILLNSNLNTIIGGRSTGKSTLLQSIAKKIDTKISSDKFINDHLENISISWQDKQESDNRDIEFFPQSYMHEIAKDTKKLSDLINKIIKDKEVGQSFLEYSSFCEQNKIDITTNIAQLFKIQKSIDISKQELKEKGDKAGIEKEIQGIEGKIKTLKSHSQFSDEDLTQYNICIKTITDKEESIVRIDKDIASIEILKGKSVFNQNFEYEFNLFSEDIKVAISNDFNKTKEEFVSKWNELLVNQTKTLETAKSTFEKEISEEKQKEIFIKGQKAISENKEYKELEAKLAEERKKLAIIVDIEKKLIAENTQLDTLKSSILTYHNSYLKKATLLKEKVVTFDNINIVPKVDFRKIALKDFLEDRHNRRSYENQNYYVSIVDSLGKDTFETKIKEYLDYALIDEIEYKNNNNSINVTSELLSTNWFSISFDVQYQNDSFENMSQGKQAFVVLKLLLEFSDKKCPILIDQPEDSLDNRAIYNELVDYIKKKKKERQIILVTHNPNVVVGADAELVIVANQHGNGTENTDSCKFEYISGSLENTKQKNMTNKIILKSQGIREHVCEILEGGKDAFEKREQKYGFK